MLCGGGFSLAVIDTRSGAVTIRVSGPSSIEAFQHEAGGHRWQRIPPTERRGRVQTSTVTVAVLPEPPASFHLADADIQLETKRGHGKGGQHRNTTDSAVRALHRPTGITAECQSERSQHQNKAEALRILSARVYQAQSLTAQGQRDHARRTQIGSGQRGDKRRTIRVRDGQVNDHLTGQHWRLQEYLDGRW